MGERIRSFDWSQSPLGPLELWPPPLRSALSICLNSNFPIAIYWGPELILLYNDQWSPIPGKKHPWALGQPARLAWPEIWHIIEPLFHQVLHTGEATRSRDQLLPMHRHGFTEECYFDYTFSPIRGEGGHVEGIFNAVLETTTRVIGERRLRTLRELGTAKTGDTRTVEQTCRNITQILADNTHDLTFTTLYLLRSSHELIHAGSTGFPPHDHITPTSIDLNLATTPWPFHQVINTHKPVEVHHLAKHLKEAASPQSECPDHAVVLPLAKSGQTELAGFVIVATSPRLSFNDDYRGFLDLLAAQIAAAIANAQSYEAERRRVETLSALDRSKTVFFSNVSHEFRTPLTLMLGPIENLLDQRARELPQDVCEQLTTVQRNGMRLMRLVNNLLDFSRIEAGRVNALFQPTDLAQLTVDIASMFRSAIEQGGLQFHVQCESIETPIYVDRTMWEQIVLNLLSNAFKFTLQGSISVRLKQQSNTAILEVQDTGSGIPAEDLPHLFERFHRVANMHGRTHEGSGIGLALVHELIKLHAGQISVESVLEQGTTFRITLPLGKHHLPQESITEATTPYHIDHGENPFVEEARMWLPSELSQSEAPVSVPSVPVPANSDEANLDETNSDEATTTRVLSSTTPFKPRVLVADDNADMRRYISSLLSHEYHVLTVNDGLAALKTLEIFQPDLVLSDVMMPELDGFELLSHIRKRTSTRPIPVILLSARAGDESRVEGMEAGADDYLVKPFSARELRARVSAHLQMAKLRRETNDALQLSHDLFAALFDAAPVGIYLVDSAMRIRQVNPKAVPVFGEIHPLVGADFVALIQRMLPPTLAEEIVQRFRHTLVTGQPYYVQETASYRIDRKVHEYYDWQIHRIRLDAQQYGVVCYFSDISRHVIGRMELAESEKRLREAQRVAHVGSWQWDARSNVTTGSDELFRIFGLDPYAHSRIDPPDTTQYPINRWQRIDDLIQHSLRIKSGLELELETERQGAPIWLMLRSEVVNDGKGELLGLRGTVQDITDRKTVELKLRKNEERVRLLWEAAAALLTNEDPHTMLHQLFEKIAPHLKLDTYFNFMVNEAKTGLRLASCYGMPQALTDQFKDLAFGQAICGTVALHRSPICANFIQQSDDPKVQLVRSLGIRAYACNPLIAGEQLLGTLSFASRSRDQFEPDELDFLHTICQYVTAAYERLRLISQLQEADRRKNEFLATLAHELRNPLAPLRNGLQVLKLASNEPDALNQSREMMERQLNQMVRLIDDLMDLSRISRGRLELRKERVLLAQVIHQAVETSQPTIEQAGHTFSLRLSEQSIYVHADVTRLAQVFSNLLNNAAKYTEYGGRIGLDVETHGHEVVVRIRDNGVGIPAPMLHRVFEMFTQVDRLWRNHREDLGLDCRW